MPIPVPVPARGTPCFHAPPTQNTAPVHEYRCMFSRDAHKKKKVFHDGTLKFHTFNSRVMVYDLDRHYIGDLHYRDDDEFGEGLELRLDRGILVQVEDRLGETQTNLEQVLNSKKDDDSARQPSPPALRPVRLTAAAASQQKPRSLKDVLAASQGPLARPRFPPQSPYDRSHALADVQPLDPSPKRQKTMAHGKENFTLPPATSMTSQVKLVAQRSVLCQQAQPMVKSPKDSVLRFQDVVDLSSDDEVQRPAKTRITKLQDAPSPTDPTKLPRDVALISSVPANIPDPLPALSTTKTTKAQPLGSGSQVAEPKQREKLPRLKPASPKPTPPPIRSQLLFSGSDQAKLSMPSRKARPKLMYRALLPPSLLPSAPAPGEPPEAACGLAMVKQPIPVSSPKGTPPIDQSLGQVLDERDENNDRLASCAEFEKSSKPNGLPQQPHDPTLSLLFVPAVVKSSPTASIRQVSQDSLEQRMFGDFDAGRGEGLSTAAPSGSVDSLLDDTALERPHSTPEKIQRRSGEITPSRVKSSVELMPPPRIALSVIPQNSLSNRDRSFRRVLSENDASFTQGVPDEDFLGLTTQVTARKPKAVTGSSPSKLRRTTSDSAAVAKETDGPINIMPLYSEPMETGPWTSTEAFLLFEVWPSGKDKPDFGTGPSVVWNGGHCEHGFRGITTARDMLRDDMNVL